MLLLYRVDILWERIGGLYCTIKNNFPSFAAEARYKRSAADLEAIAEEEAAANEIFDGEGDGGSDCQSKYMRCLATAFKTGVEHVGAPGGITE